jgi:hypothetical protein
LEKEFYLNCDLEETNKYMMMVKNWKALDNLEK